jgi:hypothetical protein
MPADPEPVRAFDPIPPIDLADRATRDAIERAQAGELLSGKELSAIFRVKHAQFHKLVKAGAFDAFLVQPVIGLKCYSGIKVWRYLCGDPVYEPSFGRRRTRAGSPSSRS